MWFWQEGERKESWCHGGDCKEDLVLKQRSGWEAALKLLDQHGGNMRSDESQSRSGMKMSIQTWTSPDARLCDGCCVAMVQAGRHGDMMLHQDWYWPISGGSVTISHISFVCTEWRFDWDSSFMFPWRVMKGKHSACLLLQLVYSVEGNKDWTHRENVLLRILYLMHTPSESCLVF